MHLNEIPEASDHVPILSELELFRVGEAIRKQKIPNRQTYDLILT